MQADTAICAVSRLNHIENEVQSQARDILLSYSGGAAVHGSLWAAHACRGPRLWRARLGCGAPLAALLAFSAISAPGATILRLPALPPLGQAAGGVANAAGGALAAVQTAWPAVGGGRLASVLQRYYSPAASWRGRDSNRHGGSAAAGRPDAAGSPGLKTQQARRSGRRGARSAAAAGLDTDISSSSGGGGAGPRHANGGSSHGGHASARAAASRGGRRAAGGTGAPAILPLRLGAWQLLAAMAVPAIASLVRLPCINDHEPAEVYFLPQQLHTGQLLAFVHCDCRTQSGAISIGMDMHLCPSRVGHMLATSQCMACSSWWPERATAAP